MKTKNGLRLLVAIDALLWFITSINPTFRESSYIAFIHSIGSESIFGNKVAMILFAISVPLLLAAWTGILMLRPWGRILYVLNAAISLLCSYFTRNNEIDFGLMPMGYSFSLMLNGFIIAMLFYGPSRRLFSPKEFPLQSADDVQTSPSPSLLRHFYTPSDFSELAVIRSILDEGKITYHIQNEGLGSLFEGPALPLLNQRRIMVPEEEYQAATELLKSHREPSKWNSQELVPDKSQSTTGLRVLAIILIGVAVMLFLLKLSNV